MYIYFIYVSNMQFRVQNILYINRETTGRIRCMLYQYHTSAIIKKTTHNKSNQILTTILKGQRTEGQKLLIGLITTDLDAGSG